MTEGPSPFPTAETRPFWAAAGLGELRLPHCRPCDTFHYPPRERCPHCLGSELTWPALSGEGRIVEWTQTGSTESRNDSGPTIVADIELAEQQGLRLHLNVIDITEQELPTLDCAAVRIGFMASGAPGISIPYAFLRTQEATS